MESTGIEPATTLNEHSCSLSTALTTRLTPL